MREELGKNSKGEMLVQANLSHNNSKDSGKGLPHQAAPPEECGKATLNSAVI